MRWNSRADSSASTAAFHHAGFQLGGVWCVRYGIIDGLALFALPVVDTLALSPLAFPRNPYHHLVKDTRLLKLAVNDPLADAQRVVGLFDDQRRALAAEPAELVRTYPLPAGS